MKQKIETAPSLRCNLSALAENKEVEADELWDFFGTQNPGLWTLKIRRELWRLTKRC
jgi:hypothetical protein